MYRYGCWQALAEIAALALGMLMGVCAFYAGVYLFDARDGAIPQGFVVWTLAVCLPLAICPFAILVARRGWPR